MTKRNSRHFNRGRLFLLYRMKFLVPFLAALSKGTVHAVPFLLLISPKTEDSDIAPKSMSREFYLVNFSKLTNIHLYFTISQPRLKTESCFDISPCRSSLQPFAVVRHKSGLRDALRNLWLVVGIRHSLKDLLVILHTH